MAWKEEVQWMWRTVTDKQTTVKDRAIETENDVSFYKAWKVTKDKGVAGIAQTDHEGERVNRSPTFNFHLSFINLCHYRRIIKPDPRLLLISTRWNVSTRRMKRVELFAQMCVLHTWLWRSPVLTSDWLITVALDSSTMDGLAWNSTPSRSAKSELR